MGIKVSEFCTWKQYHVEGGGNETDILVLAKKELKDGKILIIYTCNNDVSWFENHPNYQTAFVPT